MTLDKSLYNIILIIKLSNKQFLYRVVMGNEKQKSNKSFQISTKPSFSPPEKEKLHKTFADRATNTESLP
jgi:hypothetical protein